MVINLIHIVYQVVRLMNLLQTTFKYESYQLRNLVIKKIRCIVDVFPHDNILSYDLQKDQVGVALFDHVKTLWNSDLVGNLLIIWLQVHETYSHQSSRSSDMKIHIWTLFYTRTLILSSETITNHCLRRLHDSPSLYVSNKSLLKLKIIKVGSLASTTQTSQS